MDFRYAVVRVRPPGNIDRSSWLVLAGAAILAVVGIGTTFVVRNTWPAADTVTPTGVVATYVRAIQSGDAARAWLYLSHDGTQTPPGEPPRGGSTHRQSTRPAVERLGPGAASEEAGRHLR